jgi:hypothetical protein
MWFMEDAAKRKVKIVRKRGKTLIICSVKMSSESAYEE